MKKITGKRLPKILVVCGPTAVGKSDLAVDLALKFNGEVVSADSRQVYTGLDIGSGKITTAEMKGVPHYLLNIADPKKARYTVDDFKRDGETAIADIISRGKLPIICGGTGFYIDALVKGEIFPNVPPNQALRKKLATKTAEALMKEITKLDPRRAKALDPYNKVRIIRAIEIARALGSVPKIKTKKKYDVVSIGLTLDRPKIHSRIHTRLLKRMDTGMVQEIAKLHKKGVPWKRLEAFGLEYRYLALYLQKKLSKEEMLAKLESEIVAYSKRQMQWFKMNKEIQWFKPGENSRVVKVIKRCGIV
jgi:tRNA dimethylallyltransferase